MELSAAPAKIPSDRTRENVFVVNVHNAYFMLHLENGRYGKVAFERKM
jgi:hypothetical protein